ncbi:hypothetical protein BGP_2390 [Beggiatoa sp. PS]|nr:hypothetical protein BGP_2390 [Beggiatoa sp. PS]
MPTKIKTNPISRKVVDRIKPRTINPITNSQLIPLGIVNRAKPNSLNPLKIQRGIANRVEPNSTHPMRSIRVIIQKVSLITTKILLNIKFKNIMLIKNKPLLTLSPLLIT